MKTLLDNRQTGWSIRHVQRAVKFFSSMQQIKDAAEACVA